MNGDHFFVHSPQLTLPVLEALVRILLTYRTHSSLFRQQPPRSPTVEICKLEWPLSDRLSVIWRGDDGPPTMEKGTLQGSGLGRRRSTKQGVACQGLGRRQGRKDSAQDRKIASQKTQHFFPGSREFWYTLCKAWCNRLHVTQCHSTLGVDSAATHRHG